MQFVLVSLADEPYLDFDYPSFHVLGLLLYEIANAGFSCHQLPVAPLPVDVPPPNVDILPRMNAGDSRISRFGFLFDTTKQEGRGR